MTTKTQSGSRRKRVILGGIVGASLAGVTLLPGTGWIVRQQVQSLFSGPMSPTAIDQGNRGINQRQEQAAASRPGDFPLQMALALRREPARAAAAGVENAENSKLTALCRLEPEYSHEPSLYAAILRDLSRGAVKLDHRTEQFELETPRDENRRKAAPVSQKALSKWRKAAERGGSLDPDNAFFPLMHAVGLFAEGRDTEALVEIKRAGTLPRFDDYVRDEATGGWELAEVGQGGKIPVLPRVAISAAILLPHYTVMRSSSRLAAVQAMHLEQAGNVEEGFAIRQALVRCGARMRTDSNWLIGNFVGEAIAATAQQRPGGAPPLPASTKSDARAALRVQRYEAYLTQIGHAEEIPWVEHEVAARKEVHTITDLGLDKGPASIANLMSIAIQWAVGIALLGNILWMVVFGALATWLSRTRSIRNGERLPCGVSWGICLSLVPLGIAAAILCADGGVVGAVSGMLAAVALGAVVARKVPVLRSSMPILLSTAAVVSLFAGLFYWMSGSITGYFGMMNSLIGVGPNDNGSEVSLLRLLCAAALNLVPALTWIGLVIASRIRRVPVSVGTVRGFARAALPIAAVLSLAYVANIAVTSAREAADKALASSVQHEGRACAAYSGRAWPTFAP